MSLLSIIKGHRGASGYGYASTAEMVCKDQDLSGKTIAITGITAGLGAECVRVMSAKGAHIIGLARSKDRAEQALASAGSNTTAVECELAEPKSVQAAVNTIKSLDKPLDVLLLNAGIMALPKLELVHGYEKQFFTNHIGHFILATGLLDQLSDNGRLVVLSSRAHHMAPQGGIQFDNLDGSKGYDRWKNYGQAKLANLLFARSVARKFEGTNKVSIAVHPGVINTSLGRHLPLWQQIGMAPGVLFVLKTIPQGAATQTYAAVHPDGAKLNGEYLSHCNIEKSSSYSRDSELGDQLWEVSEEIVGKVG